MNSHNICYVNSIIHAVAWMGQSSGLISAFLQIPLYRRVTVLDLPHRTSFLRTWPNMSRQQDGVELLLAMLRYAKPSAYCGEWQARKMTTHLGRERVDVADQGVAFSIVALEPRSGTLQEMIRSWSEQYATRAFQVPCQLLFLNLSAEELASLQHPHTGR